MKEICKTQRIIRGKKRRMLIAVLRSRACLSSFISEIANFISEFNGNHPMLALFHQCCYRETILRCRNFFPVVSKRPQLLLFCWHLNRFRCDTERLIAGSYKTQCLTTIFRLTVWNDFSVKGENRAVFCWKLFSKTESLPSLNDIMENLQQQQPKQHQPFPPILFRSNGLTKTYSAQRKAV